MITLSWHKTTRPKKEGGLGLRKLKDINIAMLMKLAWVFMEGEEELGKFLRYKFLDSTGNMIRYHKPSTIWPGIKVGLRELQNRVQWMVYDGK